MLLQDVARIINPFIKNFFVIDSMIRILRRKPIKDHKVMGNKG